MCAACSEPARSICAACHHEIQALRLDGDGVFSYEPPLQRALLKWKQGERGDLTRYFGAQLPRIDADAVVPVPPSLRAIWRGIHAPTELARATGLVLHRAALLRVSQRQQLGRTRTERERSPWIVATPLARLLRDKRVLLVDDVITTGSTMAACERALRAHGVREITRLALAAVT